MDKISIYMSQQERKDIATSMSCKLKRDALSPENVQKVPRNNAITLKTSSNTTENVILKHIYKATWSSLCNFRMKVIDES